MERGAQLLSLTPSGNYGEAPSCATAHSNSTTDPVDNNQFNVDSNCERSAFSENNLCSWHKLVTAIPEPVVLRTMLHFNCLYSTSLGWVSAALSLAFAAPACPLVAFLFTGAASNMLATVDVGYMKLLFAWFSPHNPEDLKVFLRVCRKYWCLRVRTLYF